MFCIVETLSRPIAVFSGSLKLVERSEMVWNDNNSPVVVMYTGDHVFSEMSFKKAHQYILPAVTSITTT